jgi:hypothetical protein
MASRLSRLFAELRGRTSERACDEALARLRIAKDSQGVLEIHARLDGRPLGDLRDEEAEVVHIAPDVYASVPTSEGRVKLLRLARSAATKTVTVHVAINDDKTHLGRAFIDGPRKVLRVAGLPIAEPGDRFGPGRYTHCFFDEEELLGEIERASLAVAARQGFRFTLAAIDPSVEHVPEEAGSFALEVARATSLVRAVDSGRARQTPAQILAAMRKRGTATGRARGPIGRARLRRAIGWVDALSPGGPSCYRRILLESALDAGAAGETVVFGLDVGRTGHVAFEDREERTFDVSFAIPAEDHDPR